MKRVFGLIYILVVLLLVLSGCLYPTTWAWSFWAGIAWAVHVALCLGIERSRMLLPAKIAGWFWLGLSALATSAMLLAYVLRQQGGWFIGAAGLLAFGVLVTYVLSIGCADRENREPPSSKR